MYGACMLCHVPRKWHHSTIMRKSGRLCRACCAGKLYEGWAAFLAGRAKGAAGLRAAACRPARVPPAHQLPGLPGGSHCRMLCTPCQVRPPASRNQQAISNPDITELDEAL